MQYPICRHISRRALREVKEVTGDSREAAGCSDWIGEGHWYTIIYCYEYVVYPFTSSMWRTNVFLDSHRVII